MRTIPKTATSLIHEGLDRRTVPAKVSVIIPTLNEARNLPHVLTALPEGIHEVILVDGWSTDDTIAVAQQLRTDVRVVLQTRRGKGNALMCGFEEATGDVLVMIDADGSNDPAEIPRFVEALRSADFAKGSRFIRGSESGSSDITYLRRFGNHWLNSLVNVLFRTSYTDLCYGYAAFWRYCVPVFEFRATNQQGEDSNTRLWGDGFEIETLINVRAAKASLHVTEVASFERPRLHGRSNLHAFSDGVRVARTIIAERLRTQSPMTDGSPKQNRAIDLNMNQSDATIAVEPLASADVSVTDSLLQNKRGIESSPETWNALTQTATNTARNKISFISDQ